MRLVTARASFRLVLDLETDPDDLTRPLYLLVEGVHVAVYVAPEPTAAFRALGVPTGYGELGAYAGYIGSRAAPMGPVPPSVVEATFAVFSSELVRACVPAVWGAASPAQLTAARYAGVDAGLRRMLRHGVDDPVLAEAADLLRQAAAGLSPLGRPLFAAQAAVPEPLQSHLAVWHWCTALREHRGDGHVAALVQAGLGGLDSLVLHAAAGGPRAFLLAHRGFSEAQWADAVDRLSTLGLVTRDGTATERGLELRREIERATDAAAAAPWRALGREGTLRLGALLAPVAEAVRAADRPGGTAHRIGH